MKFEHFVEKLLRVLPHWHYVMDKSFKQSLKDKMSLESYYCLQTLRQCGAMTMSELARKLKISRQQATQTVDRLCDYDFIRRTYNSADRRSIQIEITKKAQDYIDQVYYQDMEFLERMKERLGEEDMEEFEKAVDILLRVLPKLEV